MTGKNGKISPCSQDCRETINAEALYRLAARAWGLDSPIGARLRALRLSCGLITGFLQKLGIPRQRVSEFENGTRDFTSYRYLFDSVVDAAADSEVSLEWLTEGLELLKSKSHRSPEGGLDIGKIMFLDPSCYIWPTFLRDPYKQLIDSIGCPISDRVSATSPHISESRRDYLECWCWYLSRFASLHLNPCRDVDVVCSVINRTPPPYSGAPIDIAVSASDLLLIRGKKYLRVDHGYRNSVTPRYAAGERPTVYAIEIVMFDTSGSVRGLILKLMRHA